MLCIEFKTEIEFSLLNVLWYDFWNIAIDCCKQLSPPFPLVLEFSFSVGAPFHFKKECLLEKIGLPEEESAYKNFICMTIDWIHQKIWKKVGVIESKQRKLKYSENFTLFGYINLPLLYTVFNIIKISIFTVFTLSNSGLGDDTVILNGPLGDLGWFIWQKLEISAVGRGGMGAGVGDRRSSFVPYSQVLSSPTQWFFPYSPIHRPPS